MSNNIVVKKAEDAKIPDVLLRSMPRDLKLTAGGRVVFGVAIIFILGAIAFTVGACISIIKAGQLKREMAAGGQVTTATVTQVTSTSGKSKRDVFHYTYVVNGQAYEGRTDTPSRREPAYRSGSQLDIVYLSSRPEISWLRGRPPATIPLPVIPVLDTVFLCGAAAIFWSIHHHRLLLSEGRPVLARVVRAESVHGKSPGQKRVFIEFTLMSGSKFEGRLDYANNAPAPESKIVVLYDRDNPRRLMRYPSPLVRIAEY